MQLPSCADKHARGIFMLNKYFVSKMLKMVEMYCKLLKTML